MAGRKRPGPMSSPSHPGRRPNLAPGSPPPSGADGEVQGGDPVSWDQLHLFVVIYVTTPAEPEPEPEPVPEDDGEQLTLPGFPVTPADHLAAMRAELDAKRPPEIRKKRPA